MSNNDPYCRIQDRGWIEEGEDAHPAATSSACGEASLAPLPHAGGVGGGSLGSRVGIVPSTVCDGPPPRNGEDFSSSLAADPVFTPALKLRFLDELSQHGNVRVAASRIGVSRSGLYLARRRDSAFAAGWLAALREARLHAEAVLAERALDGVEEQVFYRGEVIATRRRFDTRLLLAHLARLDALCAEESAEEPFDAALALAAGLEVAAPPPDRGAHLDAVAEDAGAAFDDTEPLPCIDRIEEELADELDQLGDEAAIEARLDEAYDAAEAAYCTARGNKVCAAVAQAAAQWDERQAELLAEVDALRGEPPFEVKGLGESPEGPKLLRETAALARRSDRLVRARPLKCRVLRSGRECLGSLGDGFGACPKPSEILLHGPCPLCPSGRVCRHSHLGLGSEGLERGARGHGGDRQQRGGDHGAGKSHGLGLSGSSRNDTPERAATLGKVRHAAGLSTAMRRGLVPPPRPLVCPAAAG
jgi:hypothetical protein